MNKILFETQYFGDNNDPSEVVGTVKYYESNGDPIHDTGEIDFNIGFGMKKDNN